MYCAACGSEVQEGLRYCNRCGANLAAETAPAPPPRLFGIIMVLATAIALIGVAGLAAIFLFSVEFMGRGNIPAETLVFLVVFTLALFGIEALLIRQLSRALGVYLQSGGAQTQAEKPKLNKAKPAPGLSEPKQDFISAESPHQTAPQDSEQTTRILQTDEPATRKLETGE
ncbi:MAG TPA: zinc ribbon domain-containing protein [Pyrinomonadaceae bacterium]|jgi:hypothetical protein